MSSVTTARVALKCLRTTALATALACTASGAYAGFAQVVINGFQVTATPDAGSFVFAPTDTRFEFWDLQAYHGGVLAASNTGSTSAWPPFLSRSATTPRVNVATSAYLLVADPLVALESPGFDLSASVSPLGNGVLYEGSGLMFASGDFCFWDSNVPMPPDFDGTSAFCNGSGTLEFRLDYTLNADATPLGTFSTALAQLDVSGTDVAFSDIAFASAGVSIPSHPGTLMWTTTLTAGNAANFILQGIVEVRAVPEPGVLSLAALGLVGLALSRRRQSATPSAA